MLVISMIFGISEVKHEKHRKTVRKNFRILDNLILNVKIYKKLVLLL